MNKDFSLDELDHFTGSEVVYQHWISQMCYTEGVKYLANETEAYWLIDELAFTILPRLLKENKRLLYFIKLLVNSDQSAVISVGDGNGNTCLKHSIRWTSFPLLEEPVCFYLCDSDNYYYLMLPSEYEYFKDDSPDEDGVFICF